MHLRAQEINALRVQPDKLVTNMSGLCAVDLVARRSSASRELPEAHSTARKPVVTPRSFSDDTPPPLSELLKSALVPSRGDFELRLAACPDDWSCTAKNGGKRREILFRKRQPREPQGAPLSARGRMWRDLEGATAILHRREAMFKPPSEVNPVLDEEKDDKIFARIKQLRAELEKVGQNLAELGSHQAPPNAVQSSSVGKKIRANVKGIFGLVGGAVKKTEVWSDYRKWNEERGYRLPLMYRDDR